jgi:hypothetical protein
MHIGNKRQLKLNIYDACFISNISQIIILGALYNIENESGKVNPFPLPSPKSILLFLSPSTC